MQYFIISIKFCNLEGVGAILKLSLVNHFLSVKDFETSVRNFAQNSETQLRSRTVCVFKVPINPKYLLFPNKSLCNSAIFLFFYIFLPILKVVKNGYVWQPITKLNNFLKGSVSSAVWDIKLRLSYLPCYISKTPMRSMFSLSETRFKILRKYRCLMFLLCAFRKWC